MKQFILILVIGLAVLTAGEKYLFKIPKGQTFIDYHYSGIVLTRSFNKDTTSMSFHIVDAYTKNFITILTKELKTGIYPGYQFIDESSVLLSYFEKNELDVYEKVFLIVDFEQDLHKLTAVEEIIEPSIVKEEISFDVKGRLFDESSKVFNTKYYNK